MDLHILDDNLKAVDVVDQYESLIWTERYSGYGDLQLVIKSTRGTRALLTSGKRAAIDKSYRVMTIETVDDKVTEDGVAVLEVAGRTLEAGLEERSTHIAQEGGSTGIPAWTLTETPGNIAREMFYVRCQNNTAIPADNFPFLAATSFLPLGSIPEFSDPISVLVDPKDVYTFIKELCDIYNLGFRLVRNKTTFQLSFDVYTGNDHTSQQSTYPAVIFSPELENLSDTSALTSTANLKNVAYVFAKNGTEIVYEGATSTTAGFERRVLVVKADDIELEAGTALTSALQQRGRQELAKHRVIFAFDGEIPQHNSYEYGVDYELGDVVEMRNSDGLANNMRVTEQIFVSDSEGERAYPTLAIDLLITPGSWFDWDANEVWDDAEGYWADL